MFFFSCFRRQHSTGATWNGAGGVPATVPTSPGPGSRTSADRGHLEEAQSSDRLRGATHDLFELLERVQSSRLDDQRCVLPPYFSQVSRNQTHICIS